MAHAESHEILRESPAPREDVYLGWFILFLLVVVGVGSYFNWWMQPESLPTGTIRVEDVVAAPLSHIGKEVTVTAMVTRTRGSNAFTVSSIPAGQRELLVVVREPGSTRRFVQGENLRIRGVVHTFDIGRFQQDFHLTFEDELVSDWKDRPALVARTIEEFR